MPENKHEKKNCCVPREENIPWNKKQYLAAVCTFLLSLCTSKCTLIGIRLVIVVGLSHCSNHSHYIALSFDHAGNQYALFLGFIFSNDAEVHFKIPLRKFLIVEESQTNLLIYEPFPIFNANIWTVSFPIAICNCKIVLHRYDWI